MEDDDVEDALGVDDNVGGDGEDLDGDGICDGHMRTMNCCSWLRALPTVLTTCARAQRVPPPRPLSGERCRARCKSR